MKNNSRTGFTVLNIAVNMIDKVLLALLKFITRVVFVKTLGDALTGIAGLFSNVLGLLSLAELGVGTAINFSLYRPCAEEDNEKIRSLMSMYKKAYRVISGAVFLLGLCLMPFLKFFIKDGKADTIPYFYIIYLIFLFNMAVEYLFSYKRTLAIASQKNYLIVPFIMAFETVLAVLQISVLFIFRGDKFCYLYYLAVQSVTIVLQNIAINRYLDKKFPILKSLSGAAPLGAEEKKSLFENIKGLMFHKIGTWAVFSTDNILISSMVALEKVTHYNNYSTIIQTVTQTVYIFIGNAIASFGNLIAKEKPKKRLEVFEELQFFYVFIYSVCTAIFISVFKPFITLTYGSDRLLSTGVVALIVSANFFLLGMTDILDAVKSAAGLYDKDKWIPVTQAVINLSVSIILGKKLGLTGIFIGTVVSALFALISKPFIIFKVVFDSSPKKYFITMAKDIAVASVIAVASFFACEALKTESQIINIIISLFVSLFLGVGIFLVLNIKSAHIPSLFGRIKSILSGIFKRSK